MASRFTLNIPLPAISSNEELDFNDRATELTRFVVDQNSMPKVLELFTDFESMEEDLRKKKEDEESENDYDSAIEGTDNFHNDHVESGYASDTNKKGRFSSSLSFRENDMDTLPQLSRQRSTLSLISKSSSGASSSKSLLHKSPQSDKFSSSLRSTGKNTFIYIYIST
jgi:hypothetical protein